MIDEMISFWVRVVLVVQLMFSCVGTSLVTYNQNLGIKNWRNIAGTILWAMAYWAKSGLIVIAIIYGPEKHHWVLQYTTLAIVVFAAGDLGLYFLMASYWVAFRQQKGEVTIGEIDG